MSKGHVLTVDDAFGVQDGLVYDFGAPDEGCAVFKGGQTGWQCTRADHWGEKDPIFERVGCEMGEFLTFCSALAVECWGCGTGHDWTIEGTDQLEHGSDVRAFLAQTNVDDRHTPLADTRFDSG